MIQCIATNNTMISLKKLPCLIKDKSTCKGITTIVCIFVVLCISAYDIEILKSILVEYVTNATPSVHSFAASQSNLSHLEDRTNFFCLSDSECLQLGRSLSLQKINESCYTLSYNSTTFDSNFSCANILDLRSDLLSKIDLIE